MFNRHYLIFGSSAFIAFLLVMNGIFFFTRPTLESADAAVPGNISANLLLWLKADSGVFKDGGTTPSGNGEKVQVWQDQSGGNRHATQNTLANQPTFVQQSINYFPGVDFGRTAITNLNIASLNPGNDFDYFVVTTPRVANPTGLIDSGSGQANVFRNMDAGQIEIWTNSPEVNLNLTANQSTLLTFDVSKVTNRLLSYYRDGKFIVTGTGNTSNITWLNPQIGTVNGGNKFEGILHEIIVYDTPLSLADKQKVHSYLSLKYGLTQNQSPAQNYILSDARIVWNGAATPSGFIHDITGIGKDTDASLLVTQGRSANTDDILSMGAEETLIDKTALLWSNDNGSTALFSTNVPGGLPSGTLRRLARAWNIQELQGDTGLVTVRFDLSTIETNLESGSKFALLRDTDGDFSNGTVVTGGVLVGEEIRFSSLNLQQGEYISLALPPSPVPGGVPGQSLWLKSNTQVYEDNGQTGAMAGDTVYKWSDQSVFANDLTQTNSLYRPEFSTNALNGYPSLSFGTSLLNPQYLALPTTYNAGDTFEYFTVFTPQTSTPEGLFDSAPGQPNVFRNSPDGKFEIWAEWPSVSLNAVADTPQITNLKVKGGVGRALSHYKNGGFVQTVTSGVTNNSITWQNPAIGAINNSFGMQYFGDIAEVIIYNFHLANATDRQKIHSYLSMKYGITLDQSTPQDYLFSDGGVAWEESLVPPTYKNGIIALVRDEGSGLEQIQAHSQTQSDVLTIKKETSGLDNGEAIFVSNNGAGTSTWVSTESPNGISRLQREWYVQEINGDTGIIKVQVPAASIPFLATSLYMAVDSDGDFSDGAETLLLSNNGGIWEGERNFASGEYIAFFDGSTQVIAVEGDLPISAQVTEALVLTLDRDTLLLPLDPSVNNGRYRSAYSQMQVATNSISGYALYGKLDDGTGNARLKNGIYAIESSVGENSFLYEAKNVSYDMNEEVVGDALFQNNEVVLFSNSVSLGHGGTTNNQAHTVYYDVNIDYSLPAGVYTGQLTYTAIGGF